MAISSQIIGSHVSSGGRYRGGLLVVIAEHAHHGRGRRVLALLLPGGDDGPEGDADAAGTTSYTYDGGGRLATLADPLIGTTATYSYNSDSLVSGISYGTGKDSRSLGYDGMRRLTTDTLTWVPQIGLVPETRNTGPTWRNASAHSEVACI